MSKVINRRQEAVHVQETGTTSAPSAATDGFDLAISPTAPANGYCNWVMLELQSETGTSFACKVHLYSANGRWILDTRPGVAGTITTVTATNGGKRVLWIETSGATRMDVEISAVTGGGEQASVDATLLQVP